MVAVHLPTLYVRLLPSLSLCSFQKQATFLLSGNGQWQGIQFSVKYKLKIFYSIKVWSIVPIICELAPCNLRFTVVEDFTIFYTSTGQDGIFVFSS